MLTPGFGPPRGVHRMVTDGDLHLSERSPKNCWEFKPSLVTKLLLFLVSVFLTALAGGKTGRPFWISPFPFGRFFLRSCRSSLNSRSVLLFASFLAATLASQRFFYALPLAGLQVKRVTFYFLDYVLSLYLPLKPPQCIFE
jgi:hypothetical protein